MIKDESHRPLHLDLSASRYHPRLRAKHPVPGNETMTKHDDIAAVVIGRNEGERLRACLNSLVGQVRHLVYVDSGSTDGSIEFSESVGATVVALDLSIPFTAARARNAGFEKALELGGAKYVQFVDGDCCVQPGWLDIARTKLSENSDIAVVSGRVRERYPEASVYNRLCDAEWDRPVGETKSCGGNAMMRVDAFEALGGFEDSLIAGEEPELCIRLRRAGWKIYRLDAEMVLHDAAMTRFSQFWKRARRGGFAASEGVAIHGGPPEYHGVATVGRALIWGLALPAAILTGAFVTTPWVLLLLILYPLQVLRLAARSGAGEPKWEKAIFLTIGKFAEAQGCIEYCWRRVTRGRAQLIEYK